MSSVRIRLPQVNAFAVPSVWFSAWLPQPSEAYSILAHEAIIDAAWDISIKPLLLQRFPTPRRKN